MTPNTPTLKLLSAARELTDEVIFQSEPMKIGKTYWIFVLYYDSLYKKVFNGFHFHDEHYERCFPCDEWKMEKIILNIIIMMELMQVYLKHL